jgi:uncharacterized protein (TIGR02246 family)
MGFLWEELRLQLRRAMLPNSDIRTAKLFASGIAMNNDELEIRQLVSAWMNATKAGEVEKVLSMMADDVVFLRPGHSPMRKAEFAQAARAQASGAAPKFDGRSDIQEIQIAGDWAFMWSQLTVHVVPPQGSPTNLAGPTLTIFRKQQGRWVLARDANMLTPMQ